MKTAMWIIIFMVAFAILGLSFWGGMGCERKLTTPPDPLDTLYIKYAGFSKINDRAWKCPIKGKCVPYFLILSQAYNDVNKKDTWLLSVSNDLKTGTSIDCLNYPKELDKWMDFLMEEE